jgi:pyruvate-formate lyase-activating enzyme
MDKIKKFIDCTVPVRTCNLRCHYCYITLNREFEAELPKFKYSPEHIGKALSKERLGGTCCINLCGGGETLLPPEMTNIIRCILEQGHYVMVVTNGTVTKRFEEIAQIDKDLLKRLFFKFSFQFLELKRTNQMEKFFNNIKMMRDVGCSISLEITPNDELIPFIDEVKQIAIENLGAIPHVTVARDSRDEKLPILTNLSRKEYKNTWEQFNSKMFDFKFSVFNKKRREFCYAGDWSYFLELGTGDLKQCYRGEVVQNIYEDINAPIVASPVGYNCPFAHCYNAHAWLTFGDIPELDTPTYLDMRDRTLEDGSSWCKEPVRTFFTTKLKDSNEEYSLLKKLKVTVSKLAPFKKETTHKYNIYRIFGIKFSLPKKNEE